MKQHIVNCRGGANSYNRHIGGAMVLGMHLAAYCLAGLCITAAGTSDAHGQEKSIRVQQLLGKWGIYEWDKRKDRDASPNGSFEFKKNMTGEWVETGSRIPMKSFRLDPSQNPAWLDLTLLFPGEKANQTVTAFVQGLAKWIDDNTIKYECVMTRGGQTSTHISSFSTTPMKDRIVLVLRRLAADGTVISNAPVIDSDLALGIGVWDVIPWGTLTNRYDKSKQSATRKLELQENGIFIMTGWRVDQTGVRLETLSEESGSFKIDYSVRPYWIDFRFPKSGKTFMGLLEEFDASGLRLEFFPFWFGTGHPKRFSDDPGSNTVLLDRTGAEASPSAGAPAGARVPISFVSVLGNLPRAAFSSKPVAGSELAPAVLPIFDSDSGRLLYGYLDTTGAVVIEPHFDQAWTFFEGLAVVQNGGKYGYINRTGRYVVSPKYKKASRLSGGLGGVQVDSLLGFVDTTGAEVIPPIFPWNERNGAVGDGLAVIRKDGKSGFVDRTGKFVIPPVYDEAGAFHFGRALVVKDGRCGFIDRTGAMVIKNQYTSAREFSEGLAAVMVSDQAPGRWGYVDTSGQEVVPFGMVGMTANDITDFHDGRAMVQILGGPKNTTPVWVEIDRSANVLTGILAQFAATSLKVMHGFSEGRATFSLQSTQSGGGCGFYDRGGHVTFVSKATNLPRDVEGPTEAVATDIEDFHEGLAAVKANGKWGFVDTTGRFVIPPVFDRVGQVGRPYTGSVWLQLNGRYAMLFRGRLIFDGSRTEWDRKQRKLVTH